METGNGPGSKVFAETDSVGNCTNYIFFGGQRLADNVHGDIKYYITDHLHSTGMFVDKAGTAAAIQDDNHFYPWGGVEPSGRLHAPGEISVRLASIDGDTVYSSRASRKGKGHAASNTAKIGGGAGADALIGALAGPK